MEKLFTLLFAFSIAGCLSLSGQILYQNNFDDQDWKGIEILETPRTPHPNVAGIGPGWSFNAGFAESGFVAASTSWFSPVGIADAWMILPAIVIDNEDVSVKWEARAVDGSFPDGYEVLVSTTGKEKSDFTDRVFQVDRESATWQSRSVNLSDYVGDTIHIAFRNNSNDQFILALNNISVGIPLDEDIRLIVGRNDTRVPRLNGGIALKGGRNILLSVVNEGLNAITEIEVDYVVNGELFTELYEGLNIPSGSKFEWASNAVISLEVGDNQNIGITITSINGVAPPLAGNAVANFDFKVWPPVPEFEAADAKGVVHSIHQDLADGKIVVLDFLASWCQPCANSVPALDAFYREFKDDEDHPLNVYGITIEPNDNTDAIMNGLSTQWGGTYPKFKFASSINRELYIHYDRNHELGSGGIPFFVMICPNYDDLESSEIISSTVGFNPNQSPDVFQAQFKPQYLSCVESIMTSNLEDLAAVETIEVFPNPSSGIVNIFLDLQADSPMKIEVFNALGQKVDEINQTNGFLPAGKHQFSWHADAVGTYYIKFFDGTSQQVEKITVIK